MASDSSEELVLVSRFLGTTLGEAEIEISGWLGDWFRTRRLRSVARTIRKTQRLLADAGIEPREVPLKTLSVLLDGASMEEELDDAMVDRWANMLARAMIEPEAVPPLFPQLLKELTPRQAAALEELAVATNDDDDEGEFVGPAVSSGAVLRRLLAVRRLSAERLSAGATPVPAMSRAGIVDLRQRGLLETEERARASVEGWPSYGRLTELAWVLLDLCAPPAFSSEELGPQGNPSRVSTDTAS